MEPHCEPSFDNNAFEYELLWKIRDSDCKGIINSVKKFCEEQMRGSCCEELARIRTLELMLFISKELKHKGGNIDQLVRLDNQHLQEWNQSGCLASFCSWFQKQVIANYLNCVKKKPISRKQKLVQDVKMYINQNYQQDISLTDVAQNVYVSAFYISKIFKEETDFGIKEYLTKVRMERAKALLLDSDLSIAKVARQIGYDGGSYFGKVFKEYVGITPSEYRMLKW